MNPFNILFIIPLPPPIHGSTVMCQYIKDSKLINDEFDCDYVNLSASRNMGEVHAFKFIKIWRFIYAYLDVFFKLMTRRYALCYVALAFHKSLLKDAPFVLLCKLFRRRVVIHLHGKGASQDAGNAIYRWLLHITFRNTKVILLSWRLYPDVEQFVKREDVSICPNGIPAVNYEYKERNNSVPRMLFLSNLIVSKGVLVLLDALKILKGKGYSFICDFVGGETNEIDAKRFSEEVNKRELNRLTVYHGKKYGEEKEQLFDRADIFVFPTFYNNECFPLVILEAMQHGQPVVTTDEGAIPDEVIDGENGLICKRQDAKSLAECISQLLDDHDLRIRMGDDGFKKYNQYFTIDAFELNMKNILVEYLK